MLDILLSTRINSDASDEDIKPGEYRDALNVSLIANEVGAFSKGTTYGNTDTNIVFKGLNPDAICLGTAVDVAGVRGIVAFYQRIPRPFEPEYKGILDYAFSRGMQLPSPGVQAAQNYLIKLLKRDGIWSGLDVFFCFYGDGGESFARINWKVPNDATLAVNSGMAYNSNYGFKGNGTTAYLDTKWIPSTAVHFTLNNAETVIGFEEISETLLSIGVNELPLFMKVNVFPSYPTNRVYWAVNSDTEDTVSDPQLANAPGLFFLGRSGPAATSLRKNTSSLFLGVGPSISRPTASLFLGAANRGGGTIFQYSTHRYSVFAAGEYLNTFDRESKFYTNWQAYKGSFVTPLVEEAYTQQVLMYLITDPIGGVVSPLVKSINMQVSERSYLDGYSFVNELFYFNFRESAPKMINIQRALDSPGFYDELSETLLTVIKPHPPFAPVPMRVVGSVPNAPIQKKPFQFMFIYRFSDGELSTKSPASEYLNSLDDLDTATSLYDSISVTMDFPLKDYPLVKEVELYVRNNNGGIVDWRSVGIFKRELFVQAGEVYRYAYTFTDTAVGNFMPQEQATKINEAIPQRSNYLAFIENRLFMIDSLLDYNFTPTFQILITLDSNATTPDDRIPSPGVLYATTEFDYDSNYVVGLAFYDAYGRKYPASISNKILSTPRFVPANTPATTDFLPTQVSLPQLRKAKITAKYDLRAAGNIANYGKPPAWSFWWGMIRSKNIKWEFQKSFQCLLRFPYSIAKWPDTDPAKFPVPEHMFLEDGYLYWDAKKLMYGTTGAASHAATTNMVNDYIDLVIPSNFPFALDKNVLIDFMIDVTGSTPSVRHQILDRQVVDIFANKIRIRGHRDVRWFSSASSQVGQFRAYPKFTTGVNLTGVGPDGIVLLNDETTMPVIIKRLRQNTLESTLLYDTPQVYPVTRPGTIFATFQPTQTSTIQRIEYPPLYTTPVLARTLNQGDILIQPIHLTPTTVAFNHRIKILWGPNVGDSLRLKIKVSLWQLNDLNQPILELYSATSGPAGAYYVKNSELAEYLITPLAEVIDGWYGYGVQILEATASSVNFENPEFDLVLAGWLQSPEGAAGLTWLWGSVAGNFAYVPVPAMGAGYSKTLYQYLFGVTGIDLSIEVTVEGVNVLGPVSTTPVTQHPGNTGNPAVNTTSEQVLDLSRNVVPYFVDCTFPTVRRVSMDTAEVTLLTVPPAGTQLRAELWRVDQVTRRPISVIEGSEGPLGTVSAIGIYSPAFGANKIIDTTGWYGVAIYVDLPTYGNFLNGNYASGATSWIITAVGGNPTWIYQPDTVVGAVYTNVFFSPPLGSYLTETNIDTKVGSATPAFWLPTSADPTGYDQVQIYLTWGDNVSNGWNGQVILASLWDVDQTTKQPTGATPAYSNWVTIKHLGGDYVAVTGGTKVLGNKWYALGLSGMYSHPDPTQRQFSNFSFNFLTSWTVTAGSSGTWSGGSSSAFCVISGSTAVDTGKISQALAGYLEAVLEIETQDTFTSLFANLFVGGTLRHSIPMMGAGNGSGTIADPYVVKFECVYAGGAQISFSVTGVRTTGSFISLNYVRNAFDPYMGASPVVRHFFIAAGANESWQAQGTLGVMDYEWKYGYKYWRRSYHNSTGTANMSAKITVDDLAGGQLLVYLRGDFANDITPLIYGRINMVGGAAATYSVDLVLRNPGSASQPVDFEIWAFNDPNTFTSTGTRVYLNTIIGGPSGVTITTTVSITIAAGIKYVGYRARWGVVTPSVLYVHKVKWNAPAGYNSWDKIGATIDYRAYVRELTTLPTTILANFHCDNLSPGQSSQRIGQDSIVGSTVRVNVEIFGGLASNSYTLYLSTTSGYVVGATAITGQAVSTTLTPVNPQITVIVALAPPSTGLYLHIRNDNGSGILSVRFRQITNVNTPVSIAADGTILNAKTWFIDSVGNMTQLTTTSFGRVSGTSDTPLVALPMEIILADAAGVAISAPQTFQPNDGIKTLIFAPTLAVAGNYNYGIKVKNNVGNLITGGTVRIHSINNIATNAGIAHIVANTISPVQPLYEAWNQFSLGSFVRAGYVSNFIAVVDDLIVSAFTPIQINPTSYHLVHNIVPAAVVNHSNGYSTPPDTPYNYGVVYPSISSDPDALGIVFEQKTGHSIGDVSLVNIDLREKSHSNIVRWSDPIIAGTQTNNLNAFLDSNKYPVDFQRGSVEVMIAMHDHTIFCVHTQGMSSLYVQRSTMISPAEVQGQDDQLFLTSKVVGNDNKLTSNLGTVNPESCRVVESGTIAYGFDLVRKSFWQKSNNGVRNLTYECHAKKIFNQVCFYRLKAYLDGEDVKIYSGYNEKQKSFYLTFAPFIYKGRTYPGITIAYNAYIDGFLSRYSFEPMSYLSTEDVLHSIKVRELTNPDFFGDFSFWQTNNDNGGTADWYRSLLPSPGAKSDTLVPGGTRILNPDFLQAATFWSTYGVGSTWVFENDGVTTTIPAGGSSKDLVNVSGAPANYLIRIKSQLPVAGLTYSIKIYNPAGAVIQTSIPATPLTGDDISSVAQSGVGRVGVIFTNTTGAPILLHLSLFTTVVKTFLLYQAMPILVEDLRIQIHIPQRTGSIKVLVESFTNSLTRTLLDVVDLVRLKDAYTYEIIVKSGSTGKYISLYTITDYDLTVISYFNSNSVASIWEHDQAGRTNNFFGVQYDTMIDMVFNVQAGQVRIFNSLGITSETAWSVESLLTSEGQLSALDKANFRVRDGVYSASIMRDMLTPQESLPNPLTNVPILHGSKLIGTTLRMVLRNNETLRQIELSAVYLGSDVLSGNLLARQ